MKFSCGSPLYGIVGTWQEHNISLKLTLSIQCRARGMTPLEISYACPEIKGNHDRNHWKSGNQASHQKSQFVTKFNLKYMWNLKYILNTREILKYIYKYILNCLINDHLLTCKDFISCIGIASRHQLQSTRVWKGWLNSTKVMYSC